MDDPHWEARTERWRYNSRWDRDEAENDSEHEYDELIEDEQWVFKAPVDPVKEPASIARKRRDDARKKLKNPLILAKLVEKCPEFVGDLLEHAPRGSLIIHAVNCKGVWGNGFAAALANKTRAAYGHHYAFFQGNNNRNIGRGFANKTEDDMKALAGTATIIPPHSDDADGYWIGCLFTSYDYGLAKDPADVILENTKEALQDLKKQLQELCEDDEISKFEDKIYTVRFNGGFFRVPWERTVCVLLDANFPKIKVYTDPYCMKDADRIRFFAYMEKTGQDLEAVALSKNYWHGAAMKKIASDYEPYKPDRQGQTSWQDSDGETIYQSEEEKASVDLHKPAKMRQKEFTKPYQMARDFGRAKFDQNKNATDLVKAMYDEIEKIKLFKAGQITPEELASKGPPPGTPARRKKKASSAFNVDLEDPEEAYPWTTSPVKATPKTPSRRGRAAQSSRITTPISGRVTKPKTTQTPGTKKVTFAKPTKAVSPIKKATKVKAALTSAMKDIAITEALKPERTVLIPKSKIKTNVAEQGSPVKRSARIAAVKATQPQKEVIELEEDSDVDMREPEYEDDSDAFMPDD